MIKNDRQLLRARRRVDELKVRISELRQEYSGLARELHTTPLESSLNQIEHQITEYEELTNSSLAEATDGNLKKPHLIEDTAKLLTKLRIAAGLTQSEMAERLGWQQSNLSRFESDNYCGQTLSKIAEYADALEVWLYVVPEMDEVPKKIRYSKAPEENLHLINLGVRAPSASETYFWAAMTTTSAEQTHATNTTLHHAKLDEYELAKV